LANHTSDQSQVLKEIRRHKQLRKDQRRLAALRREVRLLERALAKRGRQATTRAREAVA
jgi:hypothetical protein